MNELPEPTRDTKEQIRQLLQSQTSRGLWDEKLEEIDSSELLHAVFQLDPDEQRQLLSAVSSERAAQLVEEFPHTVSADLIEQMPARDAAPILEEMASNYRVDVLSEMDSRDTEAILEHLEADDVQEIRDLIAYAPDVAGGLMMTEFATYPDHMPVRDVVEDLTRHDTDYERLTVHYVYAVDDRRTLRGVIRLRDLVFADHDVPIGEVTRPAITVVPETPLAELDQFFADHDIAAVPVVGENNVLLGIVRRRAVLEALAEKAEADHLKVAGIVGGDELRNPRMR